MGRNLHWSIILAALFLFFGQSLLQVGWRGSPKFLLREYGTPPKEAAKSHQRSCSSHRIERHCADQDDGADECQPHRTA